MACLSYVESISNKRDYDASPSLAQGSERTEIGLRLEKNMTAKKEMLVTVHSEIVMMNEKMCSRPRLGRGVCASIASKSC